VPVDVANARRQLRDATVRVRDHGERAVLVRARALAVLSREPSRQLARHRAHLHQLVRELRASGRRVPASVLERLRAETRALERHGTRARSADRAARARELERLRLALDAHDPARTLARGYAVVEDDAGTALGSAAAMRAAVRVNVRFHDGSVPAVVPPGPDP
jgi:exodeoxyribonuclease VII large subunit